MKGIAWIGTITSIAGSFMVAFGIATIGYLAFLVGSCSWLAVAITRRDKALGLLNLTFLCANIIGLYRAFS